MNRKSVISFPLLALIIGASSCSVGRGVPQFNAQESEMIVVSSDIAQDSSMLALIKPYKDAMESEMNVVIGSSAKTMTTTTPDSDLPQFVLKVMKIEAEFMISKRVDAAMVNLGGLRSPLYKGDVTVGDIFSIFPFENELTIVELKGCDVKEIIREMNDNKRLAIGNIENLNDSSVYRIATIDYLADGNDRSGALARAVSRKDTGVLLRDIILSYYHRIEQPK
ncbi:MAG: 5'-nucleotidase C-terminal domain-containing protein [Bacteroidales bacterium]